MRWKRRIRLATTSLTSRSPRLVAVLPIPIRNSSRSLRFGLASPPSVHEGDCPDSAYADLERIFAWIAHERPAAASRVIDLIRENVERLVRFPLMGHAGRVAGTLEWVVPGLPYVVYAVDERQDERAVIAIFHGAQDR